VFGKQKHHVGAVIGDVGDFDRNSGSIFERLIFNNRLIIIILCAVVTLLLGHEATKLKLNANYEGTIPWADPFMVNYLKHYDFLQAQGNALRIVVQAKQGNIGNAKYLATLQHINDAVLDLPGINRPFVTSLWTPTTSWLTVDANGISVGQVISETYDGSAAQVAQVMQNIQKTGRIGELVSSDLKSSMIYAPLMNHNGVTGQPIDYGQLAIALNDLRATYQQQDVNIYIVGYAMIVGDMILGVHKILIFFVISIFIATMMFLWFTRSLRSTLLVVACTLVAVTWQLGMVPLFHYSLDPYSVLVPFLIFAIGMSHGAQKMNGVMQDIGRGTHKLVAARYTFRRLFVAGFTALMCDAVGFAVLYWINIQEIRELAIIASSGVAVLVFTNLILLPILLSYVGVSERAARRSLRADAGSDGKLWVFLAKFTRRQWALPTLIVALGLGVVGYVGGSHMTVGIIGNGAPELRPQSQYNRDDAYIQNHYRVSPYSMIVMADSPAFACTNFAELHALGHIGWAMQQMPEVQSASSLAAFMPYMTQLMTDDSPKWNQLVDNQPLIDDFVPSVPLGYKNDNCSFIPLTISLVNEKAVTLNRVVAKLQNLIADPSNTGSGFSLQLLAGSAGIAAATDRVIDRSNTNMLIWIYTAVTILCFITFRSWLAVVCAILPLILTSLLCRALMVWMHIGVTVATLPVVALGVGIGVDYALYVLGVMLAHVHAGESVEEAYLHALRFTGRIVMLTGLTLAVGVASWVWAPIKFQADMGLLLAFMFLWNMLGALIVLPALASFLLKPAPKSDARPEEAILFNRRSV
jgi:predicted RND superfamily exporter protein